jgi:hypothetical protein
MAIREPRRRVEDRISSGLMHHSRLRVLTTVVAAVCGGLAVLYLFFALIGTVDPGRAIAATLVALGLAAVWLVGFWLRVRTGGARVQRHDRERRGF